MSSLLSRILFKQRWYNVVWKEFSIIPLLISFLLSKLFYKMLKLFFGIFLCLCVTSSVFGNSLEICFWFALNFKYRTLRYFDYGWKTSMRWKLLLYNFIDVLDSTLGVELFFFSFPFSFSLYTSHIHEFHFPFWKFF